MADAGAAAFTLVETLVSLAIITLLLVILLSMTNQITKLWSYTSERGEQFRESREAFETITRRLSLATLNTYWDYADASGNARTSANSSTFTPATYARQSELRFISGPMATVASGVTPPTGANWPSHGVFFQASRGVSEPGVAALSGLYSMLNTWGYFVEFGPDSFSRPGIPGLGDGTRISFKYRFRLCEMIQPANQLSIYQYTSGNPAYTGTDWFSNSLNAPTRPVHVLADNIVALVLLPKLASGDETAGGYTDSSLAPNYLYDSTGTNMSSTLPDKNLNPKNQLPPVIQVTMVALDEASYGRFQSNQPGGTAMPASLGLSTLFQAAGSTSDNTVPGYAKDLLTLQTTLLANKISFRVFTTSIKIKGAKWSEDQTN